MTVEGSPDELYAQNMEYKHQYDEITKHFGEGQLKDAGAIQKDLQLHNVNIAAYYTDKCSDQIRAASQIRAEALI